MPEIHARLSASGAHRWLNCPPSVALEGNYQDGSGGSEFAREGTFAHELAELYLNLEYGHIKKKQFNSQYKILEKNEFFNIELRDHVENYVNSVVELVNESKAKCKDVIVEMEQRLDFSEWVKEGFGTGDVVVIADGTLQIIDLKFGKGVEVSAINNPQLRLYGLGAYSQYEMLYDIEKVKMTIIQPRLDNISTEELEVDELLKWAEEVKKIAEMAYKGEGEYKAGEHCKFCKAKAECRARAEENLELAKKYDFVESPFLDDIEIADILGFADRVITYFKEVQEFALNKAVNEGVKYPGFKLVEGRSNRKYSDTDQVAKRLLESGFEEDKIYKPLELKGITDITKVVGKKNFEPLLGDLIIKPAGKLTLVTVDDKRPEHESTVSAKHDFEPVDDIEIPF